MNTPYMVDMSLRDWFAGMAMQAFIKDMLDARIDMSKESIAETCYLQANEMMKARG